MKLIFNKLACRMSPVLRSVATLSLLSFAAQAQAMDLQGWSIFGGATSIQPKVSSGDLSAPSFAGTKVNVDGATSVTGGLSYAVNSDISVTLAILALPFKHDIKGDGAISYAGKIGTIKQLPPTVFGQYHFLDAKSAFRPYAGLGLTYAYFYGGEGSGTLTALTNPGGSPTSLKTDSKLGFTPQLGAKIALNDKWYADLNVIKTFLKTTTKLSTGQTIDTKLDPLGINLWVGYRF